jgi:ppGpp synthetase/RelA/SpoT-type nucleotidyltranferase
MKTKDLNALFANYESMALKYESLCDGIADQLWALFDRANLSLAMPITTRVKEWDSLVEKCKRNGLSPKTVDEIGDISGIRVVFLFMRDEKNGRQLIEENLEILSREDTVERLSSDQFGYGSIHYQVRPKPEWLAVPTMAELGGLQAEIQVRTVSQHIWAEVSHALQYKREAQVPDPIKRSLYRVSALLDLVDLEFERFLEDRDEYEESLKTGTLEAQLNPDIVRRIVADNLPIENASDEENYGDLLDDLTTAGVTRVEELVAMIEAKRDQVNALEAADLEAARTAVREGKEIGDQEKDRLDRGVYNSRVGLVKLALRLRVEGAVNS